MSSRIYRTFLILVTGCFLTATLTAQTNTFPSTGNVGIGTTVPEGPLQVVGTGPGVINLGESNPNSGKQIVLGVTTLGNGYGTIQSVYQGHGYTPLILNGNGGPVGIGTTTPGYNLDVFTPVTSGSDVYSGVQIRADNYGYLIEGGIKQGTGAI